MIIALNEKNEKVDIERANKGEKYAFENLKQLINEYMEDIYHTSEQYPTTLMI